MKKVAIVSDVVMAEGGAERVVKVLLEMYPGAELFTLYINREARKKILRIFPGVKINTSCFQKLVLCEKYLSVIKPFSWWYWERLNLDRFDLIISSSHSFMSKNVKRSDGALQVSYIQTPPRYLYDEYCEWNWVKKLPLLNILKRIDQMGAKQPDIMVANSENVKQRIRKYYQREAVVIYPPVEIPQGIEKDKGNYFVFLSRLVKQKGGELAIITCVKNNWSLVVVGEGAMRESWEKLGRGRVKFVGRCTEGEKFKWLSGAKALLYPAIEEDFGIVAVEAMGVGTPVVGYNSGGVKETVIDGVTGVLFDDYSEIGLAKAIIKLDKMKIMEADCRKQARRFRKTVFVRKFKKLIENVN